MSRNRRLFTETVFLLIAAIICSLFLCYAPQKKNRKLAATQTSSYYRVLSSSADFNELQGAPLVDKFGDVRSVKLVYELNSDRLFFIQSRKFRFHYDFCREELGDNSPLEVFNSLNYTNGLGRRYLLANLNYYPGVHRYALEFTSDDQINSVQITTLFRSVQKNSYISDSLAVLMGSDRLLEMDAKGEIKLPRAYPTDIYRNRQYQAVHAGSAYGVLRFISDINKEYNTINPRDIIVIKGTPTRIPVCAAIITHSFQTPLSHISILSHNRNMPSAATLSAFTDRALQDLIGQPVWLSVMDDSMMIRVATKQETDSAWGIKAPTAIQKLNYNLSVSHLVPAYKFDLDDKASVGYKAAQFGELQRISKKGDFEVPQGGFAIPFYYYQQHVSQPAIQRYLSLLTQSKGRVISGDTLGSILKNIRLAIKAQSIDPQLIKDIQKQIQTNNAGIAYRFRSSSNAEDKEGFSGAGLYDSKTGILNDTSKSIEKAIKAVWASTWSEAAYRERQHAGIDQATVMMGVLAHRSFPDEQANGVAVTTNLYRSHFPGYTVNVQPGEISVVSPEDGITAEQFICLDVSDFRMNSIGVVAEYITYSSINNSKRVLSRKQITQLYRALDRVKSHFYWKRLRNKPQYEDYALDVEFKFDSDGKLSAKQVRSYSN